MDWVAFSLGLIKLLATLLSWLREKELLDAGAKQQIAAALQKQAEDMAVVKAVDARLDADIAAGGLPKLRDKWTAGHKGD